MFRLKQNRKMLLFAALAVICLLAVLYYPGSDTVFTFGEPKKERVISVVVSEFKSTTDDGREIEVYRWDPGTIYVKEGETILLQIYGLHGKTHPFYIEGTDIRGEVRKGQMTSVRFEAKKEGIYRLICNTHADFKSHGPMVAHIVVD